MENKFGRTSRLQFNTIRKDGKTVIGGAYFTAPIKIMKPFDMGNGYIKVMILSASAGMLEGDSQEMQLTIGDGTGVELVSQSFEKIHRMGDGFARRNCTIRVGRDAYMGFLPQPVIPFAGSAFENRIEVFLEDDTSVFVLNEILSCGRYASGELFQYRFYRSLTSVYRNERLIYRDNVCFEPDHMQMDGMGMYEGYTHLASVVLFNFRMNDSLIAKLRTLVHATPGVAGGISRLQSGDCAIKVLGMGAQKLQELCSRIVTLAGDARQGPGFDEGYAER